ncbi:hypothetical protein PAXRUDRAFT_290629 [Paxillus rubicundulus Ve08.2h10]|uniref:Unplaced genomic scaffold scaffold_1529, whole genome shotgun sequence n=1 Tax=Paxillus rubicundulus Ve08.2h10 TaxID=930991 RepID=A0A0D0D6A6_9AGAM|nr:hypothetical protein PAXRUDRAFT_290629 [Paxillus rubicundulus Ve08.2h10]
MHEEPHEPCTSPLQIDTSLATTPPPTLPSSHQETDYSVATTTASGVGSVQLSAQHIMNLHVTELYDPTPNEIEVSQSNGQVTTDGSSSATGDEESIQVENKQTTDNGDGREREALGEPEPPSPTSFKETPSSMHEELHGSRTTPLQTMPFFSLTTTSWLRSAVLLLITIYMYRRK